jgi:hypothetical protein
MMKTKLGIAIAVVAILVGSSYIYYWHVWRYNYPFGMLHRCDKQLHQALLVYAESHGRAFPSGQATPEASLSLIGSDYDYLLPRRDVPVDVVRQMLNRGELPGPDTCGWNYVEGLGLDSDHRLALFWDKEGPDEMGRRLPEGRHFVSFISRPYQYIPAAKWDDFLEEQRKLLAAERERAKTK